MKTGVIFSLFWILLIPYSFHNPVITRNHLPEKHAVSDSGEKKGQNVSILFWNVENLYDPYDDSVKLDEAFTSGGSYHWNWKRFRSKISHIAKTILASGRWDPPAIIGFCEVENRWVLNRLIFDTPLKNWQYRIIHFDSPDARGVDVACLYRPSIFKPLFSKPILVRFPFDTLSRTRDILYIKGLLLNRDTIHLFINHWPSRRGGEVASRPRRMYAASLLRKWTDSLLTVNPRTALVIMGDFNDEPMDESLRKGLCAGGFISDSPAPHLANLMLPKAGREGSHKYQGHWAILDQFIVASTMLTSDAPIMTSFRQAEIFRPGFLLQEDSRYFGTKPSRTYIGPRYSGGFSDHLPIRLEMGIKSEQE